jgi:N-acetylglucosamine kinase-like BadF-type ATPase
MSYFIGVDGGATGTVAIISDENGKVIASAEAEASNFHAVGRDRAREALHSVVKGVAQNAGKSLDDCQAAIFGLAGLNQADDQKVFQELIDPLNISGDVHVLNDIVIAWAAATHCQPGVVVISGTGSSAYGRNGEGKEIKTLGWDYILGDQGSGYWVGLRGIQAAIKVWDGRIKESPLFEAMLDHYNVKSGDEMQTLAYSENFGKTQIGSFGRHVARCANDGDPIAQDILREAGEELGWSVQAVAEQLGIDGQPFKVGLVGGTFRAGKYLLEPFEARIRQTSPDVNIAPVEYPPAVGAIMLGFCFQDKLTDSIIQTLDESSDHILSWKN